VSPLAEFFSAFTSGEALVQLLTLIFLELVLGIDNLVFIAITTNRLPASKQHIGRRLGLMGALAMRVAMLCALSLLVGLSATLFTVPVLNIPITARSIVLVVGGTYLIFKGIDELRDKLALKEEREAASGLEGGRASSQIGLAQAIGTIVAMDAVFSLDSVITAVGLANSLPIMIVAVMVAVMVMIAFADPISNFINKHAEMKILALAFIVVIGVTLVCSGLGVELPEEAVYFAMFFCLGVVLILMRYRSNLNEMVAEKNGAASADAASATGRTAVGSAVRGTGAASPAVQDESVRHGSKRPEDLSDEELRDIVAGTLGLMPSTETA
jgi:predicted tellurium resistance membrane protein TerC